MVAMVDVRDANSKDVYLYMPPGKYTRDIPDNAVPEWYFSASKTCLLSPTNYDEDEAIGKSTVKHLYEERKSDPINGNIGCGFADEGRLLTISFHIRSTDVIKAYLFFSSGMIRFTPGNKNIKVLFEKIFAKTHVNEEYIEGDDMNVLLGQLNAWLRQYDY